MILSQKNRNQCKNHHWSNRSPLPSNYPRRTFDIFFSTDSLHPQKLNQLGYNLQKQPTTYAIGNIVVWTTNNSISKKKSWLDAIKQANSVAIANPKQAPYGAVAMMALNKAKINLSHKKIIYGNNVSQAFLFTMNANTDIGLIPKSLAIEFLNHHPDQGHYWEIPTKYYTPIYQQVIFLKHSNTYNNQQFIDHFKLNKLSINRVIKKYGYDL